MKQSNNFALDVLPFRPLRRMVMSPVFPVLFQVLLLGAVVLLTVNGLGWGLGMNAADLKTFRKTNLTTLVVWGLWWPGMIAVAISFGRAWCTVCPMELVNRVGDGVARKLRLPRARLGKLARAGWITLAIYLAMQALVAGFSIHRIPHATALMLIALFGLALLTGLVFRRPRAFCKGFCPAAALLSVYGRFTPAQLAKRDGAVCDRCETRDCVDPSYRHRFDKRSCPSLLSPFEREHADGCVLCLQCVKVCPYENMGVGVVSRRASIHKKTLLRPFEAAFVMIALGFVAHEVIGEVKWLDAYFHAVPERLSSVLPSVSFGWLEAAWFLVIFPLAVWAIIGVIGYLLGQRKGLGSLLLAAATGAAPVVALAHLAKGAAKVASWGGFLPLAVRDPHGDATFHGLLNGAISAPDRLIGLSLVGWIMLLLAAVVGWRAWHWAGELPSESAGTARAAFVTCSVIFSSILAAWALPMS